MPDISSQLYLKNLPHYDYTYIQTYIHTNISTYKKYKKSKFDVKYEFSVMISCALVIEEEKADSRAEVKSFDKSKLKHVETEEKNPTPTAQTLREELLPDELPDKSAELKEITGFDPTKKLKHVETQDKTHLPTKEGMMFFCFVFFFTIATHLDLSTQTSS